MRAYELMKETFSRKIYICIVHLSWFVVYGLLFWLYVREDDGFNRILFVWGGAFLPLVLSAGIFGDDIASGRISVLASKPFWLGELYIYRLLGLSLQAAMHFVIAGCLLLIIHQFTGTGKIENLAAWLFSGWLLFNTWAAMSTTVSVVVRRANNFFFVGAISIFFLFLTSLPGWKDPDNTMAKVINVPGKYVCPPIGMLVKMAEGEYTEYGLIVSRYSAIKAVACVTHTFILTVLYSVVGVLLLSRRQLAGSRE